MAWLKFDVTTPEKPEVLAITIAMGWEDPDLTVGKLLKVWRWFDQHTIDGNAKSVTPALLDRLIGVTGLTQAIADSGWLVIKGDGLTLPNFETHNGKTAKDRALTASRVAKSKSNAKGNGASVTGALPREEKRREDKEVDKSTSKRALKKCPESFIVPEDVLNAISEECSLVDIDAQTKLFRDYTFKTAKLDWVATWRNWMRTKQERLVEAASKGQVAESFKQQDARVARERWEQMTGEKHPDSPPSNILNVIDITPLKRIGAPA